MSCLDSLPTVNKCCCCFPLKLGTFIIAVVTMICCFNILPVYTRTKEVDSSYPDLHNVFKHIYILYIIVLVSNIILTICSVILIYGMITGNPNTALWWLYACLLNLVVIVVVGTYTVASLLTTKECNMCQEIAGAGSIAFIIHMLLCIYFMLVVNSYRHEM